MFLELDSLDRTFRQIVAAGRSVRGASIFIFVALDCDAVCAAKILTELLSSELLQYHLIPVCGYENLQEQRDSMLENDALRTVITINCGGVVDIGELLRLPPHVKIYVLDSHRPYHLANVYDDQQVFLMDDGEARDSVPDLRSEDADDAGDDAERSSDDVDDDEDGDGDGSSEENEDDEGGDTDGMDSEDDGEGIGGDRRITGRKRRGRDRPGDAEQYAQRRERQRRRRLELAAYYRHSSYGRSAAALAYELASQLNRQTNRLLWCGILGLTDQFVHERIDIERYNHDLLAFQREVESRNAEGPMLREPGLRAAEHDRIAFSQELRLMLYRRWSLYESMYHTSYVAARLGIWRDRGRERLLLLFAKLGIPQREMHERFTMLSDALRQRFLTQIRAEAAEYGLDNLFFGSFHKMREYDAPLSAADAVYGITALLEFGNLSEPGGGGGGGEDDAAWRGNFIAAFEAVEYAWRPLGGIS